MSEPPPRPEPSKRPTEPSCGPTNRPACPACGGVLVEIKAKVVCSRCRTIYETCCEGGRG